MTRANRSIGVMVGWAVLFTASFVSAQDWPQWRGPGRDGKVSGFTAPQVWPKELAQKWKTTVGQGDATPALVGDRLYVFTRQGDEEAIVCIGASDGKELWQNKYDAQAVTGAASRHPGPRSSPAVAQGKVLTLGVGGVLSCLEAENGKLAWRSDQYKDVPQFFTAMSPMIVDGMAIAHLGGKGKGALVALDLATGNSKWKWDGDAPAYGSPVLMTVDGTKQIVTITEKNLVGIALADGKPLWQVSAAPQGRFFNSASPIVDGQTVILTGQGRGTKALKIQKQGDTFAATGLWANEKLGTGYNTPVLKDNFLFGLSDRGSFFCMSAQNGQANWTDSTTRRESFGAILDAGTVILALPSSGELFIFRPSGEKYDELARYKLSDTPTYAHPVVAGNRIFVKDRDTLTLWTID